MGMEDPPRASYTPARRLPTEGRQESVRSAIVENADLREELREFSTAVFTVNFLSRLEVSFLVRDRVDWLASTNTARRPNILSL